MWFISWQLCAILIYEYATTDVSRSQCHFPSWGLIKTAAVTPFYMFSGAVVGPQSKDMLILGRCCQLFVTFQPHQLCVNIPILLLGKAKYYRSSKLWHSVKWASGLQWQFRGYKNGIDFLWVHVLVIWIASFRQCTFDPSLYGEDENSRTTWRLWR